MTRDDGGYWLPIHSGLLRDERWADLSPAQRGVWITLFLLLDGEPRSGWFRDRARLIWLLRREGWKDREVNQAVAALESAGWIVPESPDLPALTLRGWHEYTGAGGRKAVWNASRGDRSSEYERTALRKREARRSPEESGGAGRRPRRDETRRYNPPAPALAEAPRGGGVQSFKDAMIAAGLDPARVLTDTKAGL